MATNFPASGMSATKFLATWEKHLVGNHLQYFYTDVDGDKITVATRDDLYGIRHTLAETPDLVIFLDPYYAQYCTECLCLIRGTHEDVPSDVLVCDCA